MQFIKISLSVTFIGVLALLVSLQAYAQTGSSYQLSGAMQEFGDAREIRISPDGEYVVYLADQNDDGVDELYSVASRGGVQVRLNADLVSGGGVEDGAHAFQISADSQWVVYRADQDVDGRTELYSVSITGGIPEQLNVDPVQGTTGVSNFLISANSQHVIYRSDESFNSRFSLYSVPITGGTEIFIGSFVVDSDFLISADSQQVVFRLSGDLFSVDIGGGLRRKLNANLVAGGYILDFKISSDSQRVIYRGDQDVDGVIELFSVAIGDGAPVQLHPELVTGGSIGNYMLSANGQSVVYHADQATNGVRELYSVPILGGTSERLNANLVAGGNVFASAGAPAFQISADSQQVVYRADQDTDGVFELYSAEIDGSGTPQQLNPELVTGGDVSSGFKISPDSQQVIYIADQTLDEAFEIYSVPIIGGTQTELSTLTFDNGEETASFTPADIIRENFLISSDSRNVIYLTDDDFDELFQLYSVPIAGGAPAQLNGDFAGERSVYSGRGGFLLSADDSFVVYIADQDTEGENEVFARRLKPSEESCFPIKLSSGSVAVICL